MSLSKVSNDCQEKNGPCNTYANGVGGEMPVAVNRIAFFRDGVRCLSRSGGSYEKHIDP